MRTINQITVVFLLIFLASCSGGGNKLKQTETATSTELKSAPVAVNDESQKLLKYLEESGDYVNGRNFPSLIKASAVNAELDGKIKIIDLRSSDVFTK